MTLTIYDRLIGSNTHVSGVWKESSVLSLVGIVGTRFNHSDRVRVLGMSPFAETVGCICPESLSSRNTIGRPDTLSGCRHAHTHGPRQRPSPKRCSISGRMTAVVHGPFPPDSLSRDNLHAGT